MVMAYSSERVYLAKEKVCGAKSTGNMTLGPRVLSQWLHMGCT